MSASIPSEPVHGQEAAGSSSPMMSARPGAAAPLPARAPISTGPPRLTALRELQLVELFRKKGPEAQSALNELLEGYQRRVFSICARMIKREDEARDVTQDALIRVIEGLESYDGRAKLSTWIIRVTMNCCLSHLRKERLRKHSALPGEGGDGHGSESVVTRTSGRGPERVHSIGPAGAGVAGKEQSPALGVEHQEMQRVLLEALDLLDPDMRAALVLRDMQDLEYDQVAAVLGIPAGTVKSRLFRARAALRALVVERLGMQEHDTNDPP